MTGREKPRIRYPALLALLLLALFGLVQVVMGGNIDAVDKYAWGTNVGWISFDPQSSSCEGVTVYGDHLEGYAWGENVGWIRLGTHTGGSAHTYANTGADNYGVNNDGSGNLSGYAWGTNLGWINFDPQCTGCEGVTVYDDHLEGYAWGENVGWVRLGNHTGGGPHTYANTGADNYGVNNDGSGNLSGYAWGTNVGWINFDPQCTGSEGVTVYADHLEGYAWGENIGWIRLGTRTGGGPHTYANTAADNYGVNNDGAGNLSGYAWGTNVGWINFAPTFGGVTIDTSTGEFDGYAWGENIGWIHFKGTATDTTEYSVVTTQHPTAVELWSFGAMAQGQAILVAWETASEVDILGFNVYRSRTAVGALAQLNAVLVPSQALGSPVGAVYEFLDESALPWTTYYYWLEVVDVRGGAMRYGPVPATVAAPGRFQAYLPLVHR